MNDRFLQLLVTVSAIMFMVVDAFALTAEDENGVVWTYSLANNEVTIGNGSSAAISTTTSGDIEVPSTLAGYPVKKIAAYAFKGCKQIAVITVPKSVVTMERGVFSECAGLTKLVVPFMGSRRGNAETYDAIFTYMFGSGSFAGGYNVSQNYRENGYTRTQAAYLPTNLTSVILTDESLLGYDAFVGCASLTNVTMNVGMKSIGAYSFSGCSAMSAVELPAGMTSVGGYAFNGCSKLVDIKIPDSVTQLGEYAFSGCTSIKGIEIPDGTGILGSYLFNGCTALTDVVLPQSVSNINSYAFQNCTAMERLVIPDGVKSMGRGVFAGCASLKELTIPFLGSRRGNAETYDAIFTYMFGPGSFAGGYNVSQNYRENGYTRTQTAYLPTNLTSVILTDESILGYDAFVGCASLTNVTMNVGMKSIGSYSFSGCSGMLAVELPEGMTSVGGYAFSGCSKLTEIKIPASVAQLGDYALSGCTAIEKVVIPEGTGVLGSYIFNGCAALTDVVLPESVSNINSYAFQNCTALERLKVPKGVRYMGYGLFAGCAALKELTIPFVGSCRGNADTSDAIFSYMFADYGFEGGYRIEQLYISRGYRYSQYAYLPTNLTSVILTDESRLGYDAFVNCACLTNVSLNVGVVSIGSYSLAGCRGVSSIVLPEGLTVIGDNAFNGCSGLSDVTIPHSVVRINDYAFSGCSAMRRIDIPDGTGVIGSYAFNGCLSLAEVSISHTVSNINSFAFQNCTALEELTIPNAVLYMGNGVFAGCAGLRELTIPFLGSCRGNADTSDAVFSYMFADYGFEGGYRIEQLYTSRGYRYSQYAYLPTNLTSVILTDESRLGYDAFVNCSCLTNVTLNVGVVSIGSYSFAGCKNIPLIVLPEGMTVVGDNAFNGCSKLVNVVIPKTASEVHAYAFANCSTLETINIPDGVAEIGDYAFSGCGSLKTVNISETVSKINSFVFQNCTKMEKLTIPEGVQFLGRGVFAGCAALRDLTLPFLGSCRGNVDASDAVFSYLFADNNFEGGYRIEQLYISRGYRYSQYAYLPTNLTSVILTDESRLGYDAFVNCASLTNVGLNVGVESIGSYSFAGCNGMLSINLPEGLTVVGDNAFNGCSKLLDVIIPPSVERINDYAFSGCTSMKKVEIPEGIGILGSYIFNGCAALTDVLLSLSVSNINSYAFQNCTSLERLVIPDGVRFMGYGLFAGCKKLQELTMPFIGSCRGNADSSDAVFSYMFADSKFDGGYRIEQSYISRGYRYNQYAYLPTNLTSVILTDESRLGYDAFVNCTCLSNVSLNVGVVSIGDLAFGNCTGLESVNIPDSITSVSASAFNGCTDKLVDTSTVPGLKLVDGWVIGYTEKPTGDLDLSGSGIRGVCGVFSGCTGLTSVKFPETTKVIGASTFSGCTSLTNVALPSALAVIDSSAFRDCTALRGLDIPDGVKKIGDYAFYNCRAITDLPLPNSVTNIGSYAFASCQGLKTMTVPDSVERIGTYVFSDCVALQTVELPMTLTEIPNYAFNNCKALMSIALPKKLTRIGDHAFANCIGLSEVDIPDGVIEIAQYAFTGCAGLKRVSIPGSVETIGQYAFNGCVGLEELDIPSSVKSIGAYAFKGCTALERISLGEGVSQIGDNSFAGCTGLKDVTIPSTVTRIGASAFSGCSLLEKSPLVEGVGEIGAWAFSGCTNVTTLTIPNSVTNIGEYAFNGWTKLEQVSFKTTRRCSPTNVTIEQDISPYNWRGFNIMPDGTFAGDPQKPMGMMMFILSGGGTVSFDWKSETDDVYCGFYINGSSIEGRVDSATGWTTYSANLPLGMHTLEIYRESYYGGIDGQDNEPDCWVRNLSFVGLRGAGDGLVVGASAFHGCSNIKSVDAVDMTAWCGTIFANATANPLVFTHELHLNGELVAAVPLSETVTNVNDWTYAGCADIAGVTIPESVVRIGGHAFAATGLDRLDVSSSVSEIGMFAFAGCSEIAELVIPATVSNIEMYAFVGCDRVRSATVPSGLMPLSELLPDSYADLETLSVADGSTSICDSAFAGCAALQSLQIPASVNQVGIDAFIGCVNLPAITVAADNTAFKTDHGALLTKDGISFVSCPAGVSGVYAVPTPVVQIEYHAFAGCSNITEIQIPASVSNICDFAFEGCCRLAAITVDEDNPCFKDVDGVLFSKDGTRLIYCPAGKKGAYEIPQGVMTIASSAFLGCGGLTQVTIPATVSSIGDFAFRDCCGLTALTVPDSVRQLGKGVFEGCTSLDDLALPEDVRIAPLGIGGLVKSDKVLCRGCVYSVTNHLVVKKGATLTIKPGVVLKMGKGFGIAVRSGARLVANGTGTNMVVFTSIKDDECGGDSNGDGGATKAAPGDWQYISVEGSASLSHAMIRFGGGQYNGCGLIRVVPSYYGGDMYLEEEYLDDPYYGYYYDESFGELKADGCVLEHSSHDGVWNEGGSVNVKNSIFTDLGYANAAYWGSNVCANCTFYQCDYGAMLYGYGDEVQMKFTNCIFNEMLGWVDDTSGVPTPAVPDCTSFKNCVFYNPSTSNYVVRSCQVVGGDGNIWADPAMFDAPYGDYRILPFSPCVDAGVAVEGMTACDVEGRDRIVNGKIDIGAYEWQTYEEVGESTATFDLGEHCHRTGGGELVQHLSNYMYIKEPEFKVDDGWIALGWDQEFSRIRHDMTITQICRKIADDTIVHENVFDIGDETELLLEEDFENAESLNYAIRSTGYFPTPAGRRTGLGLEASVGFGFGKSNNGVQSFWNYVNRLVLRLPHSALMTRIEFKEMELYGNFGSLGVISYNEGCSSDADCLEGPWFGRRPENDGIADTEFRSRSYDLNAFADSITLAVKDITPSSEIIVDDIKIYGRKIIDPNPVWEANKTHVVRGKLVVPSGVTLTIEPKSVVKFFPGSSIEVEHGGVCIAEGVVFTHIADDTIGGDSLTDSDETQPAQDQYSVLGVADNDATEYRYITPRAATLSGTISKNEVWKGHQVYHVVGNITIASGANLTIEPGAIIKFDAGLSLVVNSGASLDALGTRALPVVFTSIKDDAHGGDTNGDGDSSDAMPGDWVKVGINGGTANFTYTHILYSSKNSTTGAINMNGGKVVFNNGIIAHGLYDGVGVESGDFSMANSVVTDCLLAFRHWPRGPIVNCVIYDCGRLTQGGGQNFINCIFSKITETWEAFGFPQGTTYRNCCFWNEGGSVLTGEGRQDAMTVCGKNGNVWGDPLFVDPENWNFQISADSPCVDAADGTVSPETDYYNQPRQNIVGVDPTGVAARNGCIPDIGIYEVQPRFTKSDIDLAVKSVAVPESMTIGELVEVSWTVENQGSVFANGPWSDKVELISDSGVVTLLGAYSVRGGIAAGGERSITTTFRVPSAAEGNYRIRVTANSTRDVYEGSQTANNVMYAVSQASVVLPLFGIGTASISISGESATSFNVANSVSSILIDHNIESVSASARITDLDSGTVVVIQGIVANGCIVLSVPATISSNRTIVVTVANGAADSTVLNVETSEESTTVLSYTPDRIGNRADSIIHVVGLGMDYVSNANLSKDNVDEKVEIVNSSANELMLSVGAAGWAEGVYDLKLTLFSGEEINVGQISVFSDGIGPRFEAELEMPSATRSGRVYVGRVKYRNAGDEDMRSPCMSLRAKNATMGISIDSTELLQTQLDFFAIGKSYPAGVLKAGESGVIEFYFKSGASPSFSLLNATGTSDDWKAHYALAIDAATRLNARGRQVFDAHTINSFVEQLKLNECPSAICGRILSFDGDRPIEGATIVAVDHKGAITATDISDDKGVFVLDMLHPGARYVIKVIDGATGGDFEVDVPESGDVTDVLIVGVPYLSVYVSALHVPNNENIDVRISRLNGDVISMGEISSSGQLKLFVGIDSIDDDVVVSAQSDSGYRSSIVLSFDELLESGCVSLDFADETFLEGVVEDANGNPVSNAFVRAWNSEAGVVSAMTSCDGKYILHGIFEGGWMCEAFKPGYSVDSHGELSVLAGRNECKFTIVETSMMATVSGVCGENAVSNSWVAIKSVDGNLLKECILDEGRFAFADVPYGQYRISYGNRDEQSCQASKLLEVNQREVNVVITPPSHYKISGTLLDGVGDVLTGSLEILDSLGNLHYVFSDGSEGFVEQLPAGFTSFIVRVNGYREETSVVEVNGDVKLSFCVEASGCITVKAPKHDEVWSLYAISDEGATYIGEMDSSIVSISDYLPSGDYAFVAKDPNDCFAESASTYSVEQGRVTDIELVQSQRKVELHLNGSQTAFDEVAYLRVECPKCHSFDTVIPFANDDGDKGVVLSNVSHLDMIVSAMKSDKECLGSVLVRPEQVSCDLNLCNTIDLSLRLKVNSSVTLEFVDAESGARTTFLQCKSGDFRFNAVPSNFSYVWAHSFSGVNFVVSRSDIEHEALITDINCHTVEVDAYKGGLPLAQSIVEIRNKFGDTMSMLTDLTGKVHLACGVDDYELTLKNGNEAMRKQIAVEGACTVALALAATENCKCEKLSLTTKSLQKNNLKTNVVKLLGETYISEPEGPDKAYDDAYLKYSGPSFIIKEYRRFLISMWKHRPAPKYPECEYNIKIWNDWKKARDKFEGVLNAYEAQYRAFQRAVDEWNAEFGDRLVSYIPVVGPTKDAWKIGEEIANEPDGDLPSEIRALLLGIENDLAAFWEADSAVNTIQKKIDHANRMRSSGKTPKTVQVKTYYKTLINDLEREKGNQIQLRDSCLARAFSKLAALLRALAKYHLSSKTYNKVMRWAGYFGRALKSAAKLVNVASMAADAYYMFTKPTEYDYGLYRDEFGGSKTFLDRLVEAYAEFRRAYDKQYHEHNETPDVYMSLNEIIIVTPMSSDPNEMAGPDGKGNARCVRDGDWMNYTIYFENKAEATAAAQDIFVTLPKDAELDWTTFELGEVAFGNNIDTGLAGKSRGTSNYALPGTTWSVRTIVTHNDETVKWHLRVIDPSTPDNYPADAYAGFLPPNDSSGRGEGHLCYKVKVRNGATAGKIIGASAIIVFDDNPAIETDPAWSNTVSRLVAVSGKAGAGATIMVDPNWIKANLGESATDAQVAEALNKTGKNGIKVWANAALGLDPNDENDNFLVDAPQNDDSNKVTVKTLKGALPESAWTPIKYRVDVDQDGSGAATPGTAQDANEFGIDISGETDPTGIYKVLAVFTDEEGAEIEEVPAANQIGILRKTAANKREIVPVPWTKFAAGAEDIAVSNLVKTAGLTAGDKLYVYDDSAKRYATWELQSDKTWKPVKNVKMVNGKLEVQTADSPEVATVKRGSGVWLERQDTSKPIALVGQYEAVGATTVVAAGTAALPSWNLIASPAISNWNLNAICDGVGVKDRIIVPTGKEPRIYTRDAGNTKWGYITYEANDKGIVKPVRKEDDTLIAPGTGLWYISEGGAPVIKW